MNGENKVIMLVSNMYPDEKHPSYGIFVKRFCDQLDSLGMVYRKCLMKKSDSSIGKAIGYIKFYFGTFIRLIFGKYDLIYVHYASHSGIPVLWAKKFRNKPVYTNVHGSDVAPETKIQEKMQGYTEKLLGISDRIVVPSEYFKRYVANKYNIQKDKFYVYPSAGVDNKIFKTWNIEEKAALKRCFGLKADCCTFGMAGRITANKGWDTFVKATKIVVDKGYCADFIIAGDGLESDQLQDLIEEQDLTNIIHRLGLMPQEKLSQFYGALDYFVFPTKREGESLGLVALEAMSCGTPVISTAYAAPNYYVKDGENGYKFEVDNEYALADLIIKMIEDHEEKEKYLELSNGAVKTAELYYEQNNLVRLKQLFQS